MIDVLIDTVFVYDYTIRCRLGAIYTDVVAVEVGLLTKILSYSYSA